MDNTPKLALPYIMPDQALKHVTHNQALQSLDVIAQLSVVDRDLTSPPVSPGEGDCYLVAAGASGDWIGKDNLIAAFQNGDWEFFTPQQGWRCWVADEEVLVVWNGTLWNTVGAGGAAVLNPATGGLVGINSTADTTNRLSVASPASLFSHEGGGHQVIINKAGVSDTAAVLMQNGFSGRAEMGLAGDDNYHLKVSADGASWNDSLVIDNTTGIVSFPSGVSGLGGGSQPPTLQVFTSSGTWTRPTGCVRIKVTVLGGGGGGGGCNSGGAATGGGGGGGAGGASIKMIDVSAVPTVAVTVGAGGNGVNGSSGNSGAASYFGAYCSAGGGGGGAYAGPSSGGAGGTQGEAAGGDVILQGGWGQSGSFASAAAIAGGNGGSALLGGGGGGGAGGYPARSGCNYGGGGGGGEALPGAGTRQGGDGAPGVVMVEEYY
ncbi:DUF2793 domain-containing protein [Hoeflea sp.]|uniref:DUF2793 domain-containing protein n=1 Tax=Hoeflea sp. TaxID=1940281 RepID=UPI003A8F86DC